MAGYTVYSQGQWRIFAGAFATPTVSLDADDLRAELSVRPRKPKRELVNQIRGTYVDPSRSWIATDFPPYTNSTYVTQDGGDVISRSMDFSNVLSPYQAQRLGKVFIERNRGANLTLPCKITAMQAATAETVNVTIPQLGYNNRVFRVLGWKLSGEEGGIGVDLDLTEDGVGVYTWLSNEAVNPPPQVTLDIPNPRDVGPPGALTLQSGNAELIRGGDGTIISRIRVSWGFAVTPNAVSYEVQWRKSSDSEFRDTARIDSRTNNYYISPVEDGVEYTVRVRTMNSFGASSDFTTAVHTVVGKTADPQAPTSLTVTPSTNGFDIAWSASPDADYARSRLYESSTNNQATAVSLAVLTGNRFARGAIPGGETRFYWVRHEDTSGNASSIFPGATSGISAIALSADGGIPTVSNAAAITGTIGGDPPSGESYWAVYDDLTQKIWRWQTTTGTYSKAADGGDITAGTIAADKIAVANLSAISSNLGSITAGSMNIGSGKFTVDASGNTTIRSATTGARLEISNNVIKVFDAAGQLRVELGELL
jgi:hypothetical protein